MVKTISQNATASPSTSDKSLDDIILNWVLFDQTISKTTPKSLLIPRDLFNGMCDDCKPLFMPSLRKRLGSVDPEDVSFFVPKTPLPTKIVAKAGWAAAAFNDRFSKIAGTALFSDKLSASA
ncbi:hypothetical protein BDN70DRAFT_929866 [Pholiota conissans]|uniref:Uncharacterized protein n=1 Tax=Pholiota conissans TaxID=109636 RepID=A0A9P6D3M2_9AGAR|nr:hypothetical protein BDN70DRAFT_929866 [Pholiota conissans]